MVKITQHIRVCVFFCRVIDWYLIHNKRLRILRKWSIDISGIVLILIVFRINYYLKIAFKMVILGKWNLNWFW